MAITSYGIGAQPAKMALRHHRLVSALPLNYLAAAVLWVVVLANLRGQGSTHDSGWQDSKQTSSGVLASTAPTYYRDVLPILRQHCVACHRGGGIAPMSFETYETARRYAYLIRNVTRDKAMPPPFSIPLVGRVTNDPSLSPAQIAALATWANLKAPRGDSHDAPAPPGDAAPWSIPKPDLIIKMPQPVAIPAVGKLDYVYEIVPTGLTEGRWIQMAEVLPFLQANLLQVMVVIRRPGSHWLRHAPPGTPFTGAALTRSQDRRWSDDDILIVDAPGSSPQQFPPTMGKFIPAGSDLVFCAQYITNGVEFLGIFGLGGARHVTSVMDVIEKRHPHEPHWYLQAIGTDTAKQGKGFGGVVIRSGLAKADQAGMPAYLESSKETNVPIYQSFGFEVTGEITLPDGPTLWPMWRKAREPG